MLDTMRAANGAGLAAPQIGVDLQLVIFGTLDANPRYPDRPLVPPTVLINPIITPLREATETDWMRIIREAAADQWLEPAEMQKRGMQKI
jgi:peptide deformylase